MQTAFRQKVTIQPGGLIQVRLPDLPEGETAEIIVWVETSGEPVRPLSRFMGVAKGGFASPSDVDEFMRQES